MVRESCGQVQIEGLSAEEQLWPRREVPTFFFRSSAVWARPKRRLLPRSDLKFEFLGDSVASTVLDLLLRPGNRVENWGRGRFLKSVVCRVCRG